MTFIFLLFLFHERYVPQPNPIYSTIPTATEQHTASTTLNIEGVRSIKRLRLSLQQWEDFYVTLDVDHDGVVSEMDFASSLVPYTAQVLALEHLHDVFFATPFEKGDGKTNAAAVYRAIDRCSNCAAGVIQCRDVLEWFRVQGSPRSSSGKLFI